MKGNYTAIVKEDGDWWIGWVEEVPGVNSQARTRAELLDNLRDALAVAPKLDGYDVALIDNHTLGLPSELALLLLMDPATGVPAAFHSWCVTAADSAGTGVCFSSLCSVFASSFFSSCACSATTLPKAIVIDRQIAAIKREIPGNPGPP